MNKPMRFIAWTVVFILPLIGWAQAPQPMPPYYLNNLSVNSTNGINLYQSETIISTGNENEPVNITGAAKVDYKASKEVELKPGFTASNFTGVGEFHAYIGELPFEVAWFEPTTNVGTVPKYEKLELGIKLPQEIQDNIDDFLNDPTLPYLTSGDQINPYNPEQISIEINLTSPDNRNITKYGFYYKEFEVGNTGNTGIPLYWNDFDTDYHFRIRIAPDYIGKWNYIIKLILNNNELGTYNGSFECIPSDNKGYLEVSTNNNRFLRFEETQESFFAIGENIAFPFYPSNGSHGTPVYGNEEWMLTPRIEDRSNSLMNQLHDWGGNYMRLMMCTWQLGLERERLGVYDQGFNPDRGNFPYNNIINRQHHAWELDNIIDNAHELGLYIQLSLEGNSFFPQFYDDPSDNDDPNWWHTHGLNTTWLGNPYLNILGQDALVDEFFTNSSAKEYYKRKLRYVMSRWGYSTNISMWEMFNEIEQLFIAPPYPADYPSDEQWLFIKQWHTEMAQYIKNNLDDKHLIMTSSVGEALYFEGMDLADFHGYSIRRDFILGDLAPKVKLETEENSKPLIIGELDLDYYYTLDPCSPLTFHNQIWSTSFTGSIGTYLHWDWNIAHDPNLRYYENFRPLANFMQGVDHEWNNWQPHTNGYHTSEGWQTEHENVEHFYMTNFNSSQVMGWFHNRTAYWANEIPDCYVPILDQNGDEIDRIECPPDDNPCLEYISPLSQQSLYLDGMHPGMEYQLQFFDTYSPIVTTIDYPETIFALYDGYVYFETPELTENKPDYAYKLWPASETSFRNNGQPYLRDTAVCVGEHFTPYHLLHNFNDSSISISWLFSGSSPINEFVAYAPGVYSIEAILNNHGNRDTITAKIFIKNCQPKLTTEYTYDPHAEDWLKKINKSKIETLTSETAETTNGNNYFRVYPVPTNSSLIIESSGEERNWIYELYSVTGALTLQGTSFANKKQLDVSTLAKGVYFLTINSKVSGNSVYKIVID